jgi:UTP--glucose-1-phosphate uridylyltransferase
MLLPDDLIIKNNCTKEMIDLHSKKKSSVIATKTVSKKDISRWGILTPVKKKKNYFLIKNVIEKPKIGSIKSNYAIIGRYILPSKIFGEIKKIKPGKGGEIHITDAIKNLIFKNQKFYANIFRGKYLDCGTLSGYINSTIEISKEGKK